LSLSWRRSLPVIGALFVAGAIAAHVAAGSATLTFGSTATMSYVNGPPVLVTVGALKLAPASRRTPGDLVGDFTVTVRLEHRSDTLMTGDAPASDCSIIDTDGVSYPSDLRLSSPYARNGLFQLAGDALAKGTAVALIPASTHVAGVTCQLGYSVATWRR